MKRNTILGTIGVVAILLTVAVVFLISALSSKEKRVNLSYEQPSGAEVNEANHVEGTETGLFGGEGTEVAEQTGRFALSETYDNVINGVRLILSYDKQSNYFIGTVENTLGTTLTDIRVEVHLSNGIELGPTIRGDLRPGEKKSVRLAATGTNFDKWTAHPEVGSSEGSEHESSEGSESGYEGSENEESHGSEESGSD